MTSDISIEQTAADAEFFLSDGVIVTGNSTGVSASLEEVKCKCSDELGISKWYHITYCRLEGPITLRHCHDLVLFLTKWPIKSFIVCYKWPYVHYKITRSCPVVRWTGSGSWWLGTCLQTGPKTPMRLLKQWVKWKAVVCCLCEFVLGECNDGWENCLIAFL